MHTDDHILETFIAANRPLPAIAAHLGMTLITLVKWLDRNADLVAAAKRALETHIAVLSLHAEASSLIDLTKVSASTPNEERKRKSASQLLRHAAKRLLAPSHSRSDALSSSTRHSGEMHPSEPRGVGGAPIAPSAATTWERVGDNRMLDALMPRASVRPVPSQPSSHAAPPPKRPLAQRLAERRLANLTSS